MPVNPDLAAMGIGDDTPDDLSELATNDPDMAQLLASMEQARPDPVELLEKITRGEDAASAGSDADPAADAPTLSEAIADADESSEAVEDDAAVAPVAATPEASSGAATTDTLPPTIPESYIVDVGGETVTFTPAEVQQMVGLTQWAQQLPEQTRNAMAAIEDGRAVPVARDEYEAFRAWQAAKPSPQAPAQSPQVDLEYADDATKAMYAELQELKAVQAQQAQNQTLAQAEVYNERLQAHLAERATQFTAAFSEVAAEHSLSDEQVNVALAFAAHNRIIQAVNDELTTKSPTGQVIREADPALVAAETMRRAISFHPELRQRAIDAEVQRRLDSEREAIRATNSKKSAASSLSSAPAAATHTQLAVRDMTPQQREAAIAQELRVALNA